MPPRRAAPPGAGVATLPRILAAVAAAAEGDARDEAAAVAASAASADAPPPPPRPPAAAARRAAPRAALVTVLETMRQFSARLAASDALPDRVQAAAVRSAAVRLASVLHGAAAPTADQLAAVLVAVPEEAAAALFAPPPTLCLPLPVAPTVDEITAGGASDAIWTLAPDGLARNLHPDALPRLPPALSRPPGESIPRMGATLAAAAPILGDALRRLVGPVAARHTLCAPPVPDYCRPAADGGRGSGLVLGVQPPPPAPLPLPAPALSVRAAALGRPPASLGASRAPEPDLGALAGRLEVLTTPAPAGVPALAAVLAERVRVMAPDAGALAARIAANRGRALALAGALAGGRPHARAAGLLARAAASATQANHPHAGLRPPAAPLAGANLAAAVGAAHAELEAAAAAARARAARERLAALRATDMEAYLAAAREEASDRVRGLLAQTDGVLRALAGRLGVEVAGGGGGSAVEDAVAASAAAWAALAARLAADDLAAQPPRLTGQLRPYQLDGVRWMVGLAEKGVNGVLADEMGLGKTAQTLAAFCALRERAAAAGGPSSSAARPPPPFLVVAPSTLLTNWVDEARAWVPHLAVVAYRGTPAEREALWGAALKPVGGRGGPCQAADVVVTSFEFAMQADDARRLSSVGWRSIVVDEGHRLKNAGSKLVAALNGYRAGGRFLLTGTPLQNRLDELWALLHFLMPDAFPSSEEFAEWFGGCMGGGAGPSAAGADADADALLDEEARLLTTSRLHQVLRPFFLRRLKVDVAAELPAKIERVIAVPASPYQAALAALVRAGLEGRGAPGAPRGVANAVIELRTIANHPFLSRLHPDGAQAGGVPGPHPLHADLRACPKLEVLDRLLLLLHAAGRRVLIFATMTRALDVIQAALRRRGLRCERIDGSVAGPDRDAAVAHFNDPDSDAFAFLLSVRAGGVGLNLQAADTVIMYDTDWNPAVDAQAQGRAHRIGQNRTVLVLRLRTAGTIEERVQAAAADKQVAADASITGGFFDGRTSEAARRDYLLGLLRGGGGGGGGDNAAATLPSDDGLVALLARPGAPDDEAAKLTASLTARTAAETEAARGAAFSRVLTAAEAEALSSAAAAAAAPRPPTPLDQLGRGKRVRVPVMAPPAAEGGGGGGGGGGDGGGGGRKRGRPAAPAAAEPAVASPSPSPPAQASPAPTATAPAAVVVEREAPPPPPPPAMEEVDVAATAALPPPPPPPAARAPRPHAPPAPAGPRLTSRQWALREAAGAPAAAAAPPPRPPSAAVVAPESPSPPPPPPAPPALSPGWAATVVPVASVTTSAMDVDWPAGGLGGGVGGGEGVVVEVVGGAADAAK